MNRQFHIKQGSLCGMLIVATLLLTACGFQLRQNSILAQTIPSLEVSCSGDSWRLCQRLKNQFQTQGLELSSDAPYLLKVNAIKSKTRALTITSDASVAEYQLTQRAHYELIAKSSEFALHERTVKASRIYNHDNAALLAQEQLTNDLEISLQKELADLILNQLSLIDINTIHLADSEKE